MSVASLERKKKALEMAIEACKTLQEALRELPREWADEVLAELKSEDEPESKTEPEPEVFDDYFGMEDSPLGEEMRLLSPSRAVISLLVASKTGLSANTIVNQLVDRIETKSKAPKKMLYSVLYGLKMQGLIEQTPDKRYRISAVRTKEGEKTD